MNQEKRRTVTKARNANVVNLLRAVALVVIAALGLGCPGTLDPSLTGTAASGTGGAGVTGGTGATNGAGCADGGAQIVASSCATIGCHDSTSMEGGLDLTPNSAIGSRLVGVTSTGDGPDSVCGGKTYLVAGSNPASGLLIDKIKGMQSCGAGMPYPGVSLLPAVQQSCIEQWAEGLINPGTSGGGQLSGAGGGTGTGGATTSTGGITGTGGSGISTNGSGGSAEGGTSGATGGGTGGSPAGKGGAGGRIGTGGTVGAGGTTGAAGRGGTGGTTGGTNGTFTQVAALLMTNCAPCHDGTAHTDLRTTGLYARIVGGHSIASANAACVSQTLVVAGNSSMSLISKKVHGANLNGCGTQMPKGCTPGTTCLTTAQMSTIDTWINAGALND